MNQEEIDQEYDEDKTKYFLKNTIKKTSNEKIDNKTIKNGENKKAS